MLIETGGREWNTISVTTLFKDHKRFLKRFFVSRTYRTQKYRYGKLRRLVVSEEITFPILYNNFNCYRRGEARKYAKTDWGDFYRCRWLQGYDGGDASPLSDFSCNSDKGYTSWRERDGMRSKRWCKKVAAHARRRWGKLLIEEFFNEDDGFDVPIPPRSSYPRKKLSWKEKSGNRKERRMLSWNKLNGGSLSVEEIEERKLLRAKWERRAKRLS